MEHGLLVSSGGTINVQAKKIPFSQYDIKKVIKFIEI